MKVIGLTGGIGSGKSTVAKIIKTFGYPVFEADRVSKEILFTSETIMDQLIQEWGGQILQDGKLNKQSIAQIVFNDKKELAFLESILHPEVRKSFEEWKSKQNSDFVFKEVAILFEKGGDQEVDFVVSVSAPKSIRIHRVMSRDGITEEEVKARMNNQWTDQQREAKSNFVIINDGEQMLIPQVQNLISLLSA